MSLTSAMSSEMQEPKPEQAARLTADRDEIKYLLPATQAPDFIHNIAERLSPHRYRDARVTVEAPAEQYATTVYFDTAGNDLYRAAVAEPMHVKVRAREYYDPQLDRPDLGVNGHDVLQSGRVIWIELKVRDGQRSRKRRVCISKLDAQRLFCQLDASADLRDVHAVGDADTHVHEIASELEHLRSRLHAPLQPSCVVNYRRLSWQDSGTALRITLDRDVSAFAPPADLWTRSDVLTRRALGQPTFEESCCVLEVKSRGPLPAWLQPVLEQHRATEVAYSKFVMASRAVHGPV
jgi:hypothetical protein